MNSDHLASAESNLRTTFSDRNIFLFDFIAPTFSIYLILSINSVCFFLFQEHLLKQLVVELRLLSDQYLIFSFHIKIDIVKFNYLIFLSIFIVVIIVHIFIVIIFISHIDKYIFCVILF